MIRAYRIFIDRRPTYASSRPQGHGGLCEASKQISMTKRKRQAKKKLSGNGRIKDAERWLKSRTIPDNLVDAYSKRYGINDIEAREELMTIGYHEDILIQEYEKEGIKWEYNVKPLSGEMVVVPEGTEDHEIYEYYSINQC